jgi:hypothetical protein
MPLPRRVGKLVVHVLGPTVGLAGQKTFLDADNPKEAVDPESEQDWHHNVDPPHVDHHFSRNILHLPYGQNLNPLGARAAVNCGLTVGRQSTLGGYPIRLATFWPHKYAQRRREAEGQTVYPCLLLTLR